MERIECLVSLENQASLGYVLSYKSQTFIHKFRTWDKAGDSGPETTALMLSLGTPNPKGFHKGALTSTTECVQNCHYLSCFGQFHSFHAQAYWGFTKWAPWNLTERTLYLISVLYICQLASGTEFSKQYGSHRQFLLQHRPHTASETMPRFHRVAIRMFL